MFFLSVVVIRSFAASFSNFFSSSLPLKSLLLSPFLNRDSLPPPPTAVAPAITIINSDVCAVGYSGAAQTQILGIAFGGSVTDKNCERLKLARSTFDMGMKVAAVAIMCQDERVFSAMMNAGTPCPVDGKIGEQAKAIWEANPERKPQKVKSQD
jgi:hypothetical protein